MEPENTTTKVNQIARRTNDNLLETDVITKVTPTEQCVFSNLLKRWTTEQPDKVFARFFKGEEWTYEQTYKIAARTANAFSSLDVKQGDFVLCWLPNGPEMIRVWLGLNLMGAVFVPFNTSYRGALLENVLRLSGAKLLVGHEKLIERLREVDIGELTDVVSIGAGALTDIESLKVHPASILDAGDETPPQLDRSIEAWDNQTVIFTSGTTGPSKAVLSSYAHLYAQGPETFEKFTSEDCFKVNLPLYHCGGTMAVGTALARGGSIGVVESFHPDTFWEAVREMGCTWSFVIISMPQFLLKQPASPQDKNHPLRTVIINTAWHEFKDRFGCDGYTLFNMSEVCTPIFSDANPQIMGTCGKLREGIEARLVDDHDNEVPVGSVGQLIMRTQRPYMFSHEYLNNSQATASAWRNGWFHTGDLLRKDEDGNYFFVDRLKDVIRRRGENISSIEVEASVVSYPGVREVAAVPVRDASGDEEVLVIVTRQQDQEFDYVKLIEHCVRKLPHFMVPRYVRVAEDLPRTPTGKIQKVSLVEQGLTQGTWDREAAGIVIKRERLT